MAYTNAIFYVDLYNGNNAARTPLTGCTVSNTTGTTVNVFYSGHGLTTGAIVDTTLFETYLNGEWKITTVDNDNFTLDTAVWVVPTTGTTGTVTPRGGSSWADAWLNISSGPTAARIKGGDEIRVSKTPDPVSIGNATWTKLSAIVSIDSTLTKALNPSAGSTWTVSTNITRTSDGSRKYGSSAERLNIGSAFTTGKIAYIGVTGGGAQDFSAYQKVNFWIRSNTILAASTFELWLCSDATGDVPVHIIPIPNFPIINLWQRIVWDNGAPLDSAIQSISLQALVDPGTPQIIINNIFASNDVTLHSSIGLSNDKDYLEWYPIQSVFGSSLQLDSQNNDNTNSWSSYKYDTKTVETFIRPFFKVGPSSTGTSHNTISDSGVNSNLITYTGGWNTSTNERDGLTVYGSVNINASYGMYMDLKSYIKAINFGFDGLNRGIYLNNTNNYHFFENIFLSNCEYGFITNNGSTRNLSFNKIYCINNRIDGFNFQQGLFFDIKNCKFISNNFNNSTQSHGITFGTNTETTITNISNCEFIGNYLSLRITASPTTIKNCLFEDAIFYTTNQVSGFVSSMNHGQTWGNNYYAGNGYAIFSKISPYLNTPACWQIRIGNSTPSVIFPINFKIGEFLVEEGQNLTVTVPVKKSFANNCFCRLVVFSEDLYNLSGDVEDIKASDTNWENLTISLTAPQTMVIPVYVQCYYLTGADDIFIASIDSQIINNTQLSDLLSIPDLYCMYEADAEVFNLTGGTIQQGEQVGRWKDLSDNGFDLTGSSGPTWSSSGGTNNLPSLDFDGIAHSLQTIPHIRNTGDFSVFMLLKYGNATRNTTESVLSRWHPTYRELVYQGEPTSQSYNQRFYTTHNNSTSTHAQCGLNKFDTYRLIGITSNSACANQTFFFVNEIRNTSVYDSTTTTLYPLVKIIPSPVEIPLFVGRQHDTSTNSWFQGSICSIIAINREVSTYERALIYNYYQTKWGAF